MDDRLEFGSTGWAEAAARILAEVVAEEGDALAGQSVSVQDVYVGAPAHLGGPRITFCFGLEGGRPFAELGARGAFDMRMEMAYEAGRAGAKAILGKSAEDIEARRVRREAAVAAGALKVEGSVDGAPLRVRQAFAEWHNRLATFVA
jgi:hypothetical protein